MKKYSTTARAHKGYLRIALDPLAVTIEKHPRVFFGGSVALAISIMAMIFMKSESEIDKIWKAVALKTVEQKNSLTACETYTTSGLPWRRTEVSICGIKKPAESYCVDVQNVTFPEREKKTCFVIAPKGFEKAKIIPLNFD